MANSSINLVSLDTDQSLQDFISHLQNQDRFKDYDFSDSNIRVLLEILSYNTYKYGFYLNMNLNESFLDSAQIRESITSKAKELNYMPRSVRSPKAKIGVSFTATGENQPYTIPKGSSFTTIVKNDTYIFSTAEDITVSSSNTDFYFETDIYEGIYVMDSYIYDSSIERPKFEIKNKNVDTSSLEVYVIEDGSVVKNTYKYTNTLLGVKDTSKVYFLQVNQFGNYEVLFGENILGKEPKHNSIIILEYRTTVGTSGNGAKIFGSNFDPTDPYEDLLSTPTIKTIESAINGSDKETDESVRFYAPRYFQTQERGVVESDYEILLKTKFPEINTISAYSGAEITPPQYGKVFISVDISNIDGLPESKKLEYYNYIKSKCMFEPILVEPDYLYYKIISTVKYNLNVTNVSKDRIKTLVVNSITNYDKNNLNDFNSTLIYSTLTTLIDDSDTSIIGNDTEVQLYKKIDLNLESPTNYIINFDIPLKNNIPYKATRHSSSDDYTIYSSQFIYNGTPAVLEDDGEGIVRISKYDGVYNTEMLKVGTIDYDLGIINLNNFIVDTYQGDSFKIYAKTETKDIWSSKNTILKLDPSELDIQIKETRI